MILYPTETVYGLGVNALDEGELKKLYEFKGRDESKNVNWLVRNLTDIERYAEVGNTARRVITHFLPGPLAVVLPLKKEILAMHPFLNETIGFRISSDPTAQKVVQDFMEKTNAPLTTTSANISGQPTLATVPEILAQFGSKQKEIDTIIDDGERNGLASTVIEIKDECVIQHREGPISFEDIQDAL